MRQAIIVYITLPDAALADSLARELVEAGLAAGAHNLGMLRSVYRWRGEIRQGREWLLLCQAPADNYDRIEEFVKARHPFEVPCIMGLDMDRGHGPFMDWIARAGH